MADKEPVSWITVNGVHVPIHEGESKQDAINKAIAWHNEDKKSSDIAKAKEEADRLNKKDDNKSKDNLESKYKNINPNFKQGASNLDKDGYNNNCVKCALAFEANMRGADTQANPFKFGYSDELDRSKNVNNAFGVSRGDVFEVGNSRRDAVVREIELSMKEDFGRGSRAIIQIQSGSTRHTMNVINDNGKVKAIDAQSGQSGSVSQMLKGLPTKSVAFFRTDDKEIKQDWSDWAYKNRR